MLSMRVPREAALGLLFVVGSLSLCHCGSSSVRGDGAGEPELSLFVMEDVATGSETFARLEHDCPSGTRNCNKPAREPVIDSVSVDDPSIAEIVRQSNNPDTMTVRAKRDGTVTLKVAASSGDATEKKELTATIRVATPDRVTIEPPHRCEKPVRVGVSSKFTISAQLWKGPTRLQGSPFPFPIKSDVATMPPGGSFNQLDMEAQAKRGSGTIQSTLSEADALPIEIYDADQVSSIVLTPSSSAEQLGGHPLVKKGASFTIDAKISVTAIDGSTTTLCAEKLPASITSDHPEVCTGQRLNNSSGILVSAKDGGQCTLTMRIGATAVATQTLEIREDARGF